MADKRIIFYRGETIQFKAGQNIKKMKTDDFITSLIQHVPPKHFRLIRHYGRYRRNFTDYNP